MKVCVFGAGSIGGYLAARLLKAGTHEVSVVARGEQLLAVRADGLRLITPSEDFVVRPHAATDRARELPPQDLVLVALKAHSLPAAAADIAALLDADGSAVFANNGIPWWWPYRGAAEPGVPLPLIDPDAGLWRSVLPGRALGCVVYSANEVVRPGMVRHSANNQWMLGEPDGTLSARVLAAVDVMRNAGLNAEAVPDIRRWIWIKLLRNAALNSVCALTRLAVEQLASHPGLVDLCHTIVDEIAAIALADGTDVRDQVGGAKNAPLLGAAIDGARAVSIRPSMLQDVEHGRNMEIESILGQVQAIARGSRAPCPAIDVVLSLVRGLDSSLRQASPESRCRSAQSR